MFQKRSRREKRNKGQLLLLIAGVLLLLLFGQDGFLGLAGCDARTLSSEGCLEIGSGCGDGRIGRGLSLQVAQLQARNPPPPSPGLRIPPQQEIINRNQSQNQSQGTSPINQPQSPAPNPPATKDTGPKKLVWALLIGPLAILIVLGLFLGAKVRLVVRKRQREGGTSWKKGISDSENEELQKTTFAGVPSISLEELEAACEEFTNVVSTASDGIVYKGIRASDGLQIAVTRMLVPAANWTPKKEIAFRRKVEDLARMSHDNLVNLVAYSTSEKPFERMLVFEYASNGTLYEHLHVQGMDADLLDWGMRMRIIMGAAYGLRYMHHELDPPASHFKFDASHVLLTEDYAAKVADFGLPDVSDRQKSLGRRRSFKKIVKAIGYADWDGYRHTPYFESNIRSFGVFLLETVTGRTPYTDSQGPLIEWARDYLTNRDKMWYLVDPSLNLEYNKAELEAVCEVVSMCIQPKANKITGKTPTMRDVTDALAKALKLSPDAANNKGSPLLWAEMQLLDNSMDESDVILANSPRHRRMGSTDSYKGSSHPAWVESDTFSPAVRKQNGNEFSPTARKQPGSEFSPTARKQPSSEYDDIDLAVGTGSPRSRKSLLGVGGGSIKSSNRFWAGNASELEHLSSPCLSCEDPEAPLAASINSSTPTKKGSSIAHESFGRSFRRVWSETATEIASRDHASRGP